MEPVLNPFPMNAQPKLPKEDMAQIEAKAAENGIGVEDLIKITDLANLLAENNAVRQIRREKMLQTFEGMPQIKEDLDKAEQLSKAFIIDQAIKTYHRRVRLIVESERLVA